MKSKSRQLCFDVMVPAIALISGLTCAWLYWSRRTSLWEDEIIAITHGLQPFPEFFVETVRNDIHPFLYFMLLKGWTSLSIGSDKWALANSLAEALLSAAIVAFVAFRVYGKRATFWAIGLFCVLPTFAWSAGNLRMYALIPGMVVACWFINRQYFLSGRRAIWVGIVLCELLVSYVHAIEFYFVAFVALANLVEHWRECERKRLVAWFCAQCVVLAGIFPLVLSALVRGTEPLSTPDLASFLKYPAMIFTTWPLAKEPAALALGGLTFLFLLISGLSDRRSRVMLLIVPCGALAVCIFVSSLGKPMFKPPVFSANLTPFLILGGVAGISAIHRPALKSLVLITTLVLSIGVWPATRLTPIYENYKSAGLHLKAYAEPGDVVVIPNLSVFWGIARYAVSPEWGQPLDVMPLESNELWEKLKRRLGNSWVSRLHLAASTDFVEANQVKYVVGKDARHHLANAARVWIVHRMNYRETVDLLSPAKREKVDWFGTELSVSLLIPDRDGAISVSNPEPSR